MIMAVRHKAARQAQKLPTARSAKHPKGGYHRKFALRPNETVYIYKMFAKPIELLFIML